MNKKEANQLISKYYAGETSREEERRLKAYFCRKNVPEELQQHAALFFYYELATEDDAAHVDPFAKIDFEESENRSEEPVRLVSQMGSNKSRVARWSLRIAAGIALLLLGFAAGQLLSDSDYASNDQVAQLQEEVQQMKNILMNGNTYRNVSAGERLAAVNSSALIPIREGQSGEQITDILIHVMNNDKTVNVRMAAAEALFRFKDEPKVRRALIASLNRQDEPLMQITLIDMLVELKAKDAVQEMEKMLVDADTRDVVKDQLRAGIAALKI